MKQPDFLPSGTDDAARPPAANESVLSGFGSPTVVPPGAPVPPRHESMHSLWELLRPTLFGMAAFSFVINVLFLVPAIFMLQVFDRVLPSNSGETLLMLLLGTSIGLGLLFALDFARGRLQNLVGTVIDERLSPSVVTRVVERAARGSKSAVHLDSLRDVGALRAVFNANALVALFDAPWIVIYVGVIALFHPLLGAGAAGAALAMLLLAWGNDVLGRRAIERQQDDSGRLTQYLESSLRNAEVLEALGMTGRLLARWSYRHRRLTDRQRRANPRAVFFAAAARLLRQLVQVLMLGLGAWLVLAGHASAGVMIATTVLLGRAVQPVEQLVASWRVIGEARAALRRLRAMSDKGDEDDQLRMSLPRPEGELTVAGLSYRPAGTERLVLAGVNLSLKPGQALAVIGPSAAGKSTLSRLLVGVWAPTHGAVRLDGVDVCSWSREELGPWIGYLPQDVELFDGTVAENIARLGDLDGASVIEAAKLANVHELILSLPKGYDTPVGERGALLSPGQRQRIALARALYGDPKYVVLDEPNSNLDGAGEVALAQALSGLRERGITSIIVTHRPSLVAHVDKVLVLDNGKVDKYGPAAEVMRSLQVQAQAVVTQRAA
jgi:PrtD family type I secretion system ABC transporter